MFYRVIAQIAFTSEDEGHDFYRDCELAIKKPAAFNPDTDPPETSFIMLERCHHDQDPTIPCVQLAYKEIV